MSKKNVDKKGRLRSVTVGFRMSPEEANLLNRLVNISGLNKQDYLINRALQRDITVMGTPKMFIGLKRELSRLYCEFQRLASVSEVSEEQLTIIDEIVNILNSDQYNN